MLRVPIQHECVRGLEEHYDGIIVTWDDERVMEMRRTHTDPKWLEVGYSHQSRSRVWMRVVKREVERRGLV